MNGILFPHHLFYSMEAISQPYFSQFQQEIDCKPEEATRLRFVLRIADDIAP